MNPWFAKATVLASSILIAIIRAPHVRRGRGVKVARNRRGILEIVLMTLVRIAFLLPLIWVATSFLAFADYRLRPVLFIVGALCLVLGLRLLARSHADLGMNWSATLEVRENHQLISQGLYRQVRHPMYLALLTYGLGQALVLPNWLAGPSYGVAIALLFALRLGPAERMMLEEFGTDYKAYIARTKRLVPGLW